MQDSGEPGIGGVRVELISPDDPTGGGGYVTGNDGGYLFSPPAYNNTDQYFYVQATLGQYRATWQHRGAPDVDSDINAEGKTAVFGHDPADQQPGYPDSLYLVRDHMDIGLFRGASVSDRVWLDADGDGKQIRDPQTNGYADAGVGNVKVQLLDGKSGTPVNGPLGDPIYPTYTSPEGFYTFIGVGPGDYKVRFTNPDSGAYEFTDSEVQNAGETDDSDPYPDQEPDSYGSLTATTQLFHLDYAQDRDDQDAGLRPKPTVTATVLRNALEYDASTGAPIAGLVRFTRSGGLSRPLQVDYRDDLSGTADSGNDYTALSGSAVIPAGSDFVDVAIDPADDGIWEWTGPETINLTILPLQGYIINGANLLTVTISEYGTPTITPMVDDTVSGADDYSLVGKAVNVGYQINGDHVLRQGSVLFAIDSGPGELTGPSEVALSLDSTGYGYIFTSAVPIAPEDFLVTAQIKMPAMPQKNNPPLKPLPLQKIAGVQLGFASEGSRKNAQGDIISDGHIRSSTTPDGMSDRIRPRINTTVDVLIAGNLPAGAALGWRIAGQSGDNGTVLTAQGVATQQSSQLAFLPIPATANNMYARLSVHGEVQTKPGSAGNLKFEIDDINKPNKLQSVSSANFSITAIPVSITMRGLGPLEASNSAGFIPGPNQYLVAWGAIYRTIPVSDSGDLTDLTEISIKENIVNHVATDMVQSSSAPGFNPNFQPLGPIIQGLSQIEDFVGIRKVFPGANINEAARAGSQYYYDLFTGYVTQTSKTSGVITNDQYFTFEDKRTASTEFVIKASGFKHTITVSKDGDTKFKLVIKKQPGANSGADAGTMSAAAQADMTVYVTKPAN